MNPTQGEPVLQTRLPSLTSLRFFAAALVVVVHLQAIWPGAVILQRGEVGVSFFYVLSGFILAWRPSSGDTAARFYRRRFARIVPVHLLTWAVAIAVYAGISGSFGPLLGDGLSLVLLQAWVPVGAIAYSANGVAWSLSVEVLFYACFPLLLRLLRRLMDRPPDRPSARGLWIVVGAMLGLVLLVPLVAPPPPFAYIFPPARLPEFVIGVAVSLLVQAGWRPPIGFLPAAVIAGAAVAVGFVPGFPERWVFAAVTVVPFALLIAAACRSDVDGTSRLAGRAWVRLGEWSFALFMTHQIVLRAFDAIVPDQGLRVVLLVPVLALCVAIAGATFHFVERPLERRLRGPAARPMR
ncbi:acyltransferase family protein [uncultured Amnibacterium sp.]|uniref:acyltransferase family protein n=1 Tax=uncultured Amnibacterium sp. TaxID=1631851 RepID=UPI0035C9DBE3